MQVNSMSVSPTLGYPQSNPSPILGHGGTTHPFLDKLQQIGELDLTAAVRQVLTQTNIGEHNLAAYDSHPGIIASKGKSPDAQLWYQKDFWNYQLTALQTNTGLNTLEDRLLVGQFNDPVTWLVYFTNNVMDLVHVYDMPYRHGW